MKTTELLARLEGVESTGDKQWLALCPGHHDKSPSLSVKEADNKILLHCFAGCKTEDILKSLHLNPPDLYLNSHQPRLQGGREHTPRAAEKYNSAGRVIEEVYPYTGVNGEPFQVVRYRNPKKFSQRRPDGKGDYLKGRGDIVPTLYRQDELPRAIAGKSKIYVVEGEKDTDRLRGLGLAATTNPGGAGKWVDGYSESLRGANVVVIPDKDDAGLKHGEKVAMSLQSIAASIRVLELPGECEDVSEWLANGGTREELERRAHEVEEWIPGETAKGKKAKDTEKEAIEEASFLVHGNCLYEQICADGEVAFIEYDTSSGEVSTVSHILQDGVKIVPRKGEEIRLGAVRLPSGVAEYGDTLELLQGVEEHIGRYLDVSREFLRFASYYVLLSWVYDRFTTLPYLRALGDTGCGKSRFLDVCGGLCYKPIMASGCITPAPIYRMLNRWAGTIILDEADIRNSDEYNEVVTILNCGFERGRPVIRATLNNPDKLQFLPTFGPKVFATRRRFKDPALEARCLTEIMTETTRDDIPATLGSAFEREQSALRNKLLLYRLRNYSGINPEEAVRLDLHGIEPRLRQISACFTALFAGHPDVLENYQRFIKSHQAELIEQRAATRIGRVVEKLFTLMEHYQTKPYTIVTNVTNVTLLPINSQDIAEPLGMTPQAVGQILKGLGLESRRVRVEGKLKRCIVYDKVKLDTLKRRYVLPQEDCDDCDVCDNPLGANADCHTSKNTTPGEPMPETEGLPLLGIDTDDTADTVDNGGVQDSRYENQTFDTLTGLTDGNTPPAGLPCHKGQGICTLRTDASKPFQCGESPGRCQFITPLEGT